MLPTLIDEDPKTLATTLHLYCGASFPNCPFCLNTLRNKSILLTWIVKMYTELTFTLIFIVISLYFLHLWIEKDNTYVQEDSYKLLNYSVSEVGLAHNINVFIENHMKPVIPVVANFLQLVIRNREKFPLLNIL